MTEKEKNTIQNGIGFTSKGIATLVILNILTILTINKLHAQIDEYTWKNVAIGGGGYVTGVIVHPQEPDHRYIRTDVGGAYKWNQEKGQWTPIMNWLYPLGNQQYQQVDGIAVDPENPEIIYVAAGNNRNGNSSDVLKTTDGGKNWQKTGLNKTFNGNGDYRWHGELITVDPNSSSIIYCGTRKEGLFMSTDGAQTWHKAKGVPESDDGIGIRSVAVDPRNITNGVSSIIYASVYDKGIYRSTNGGTHFELMENSPAKPARLQVNSIGVLYVTFNDGVKKYDGKWHDITPVKGDRYCGLTIDPADPMHVLVGINRYAGNPFRLPVFRTQNGGKSWHQLNSQPDFSTAPGWFPETHFSAATSSLTIDPHYPGRVYLTDWYSPWHAEDVRKQEVRWVADTRGHEEMVVLSFASPAAGAPLINVQADNCGMRHENIEEYPNSRLTKEKEGTGVDFCEKDPNYIAIVTADDWDGRDAKIGISNDNGKTFKLNETPTGSKSGKVAYSANMVNQLVYLPGNSLPYFSADQGKTWTASEGAPSNAIPRTNIFTYEDPLDSDRVNGNVFYLYADKKFYRTDDAGASWKATADLPAKDDDYVNVKSAPGKEGEVWVSLGKNGLWQSSDKGISFKKVDYFDRTRVIGFGKEAPGINNATLYVYGTHEGAWGVYRSVDLGKSWVKISQHPVMTGDQPTVLEGDRQVYGRVYVGWNGKGIFYGEIK